MDIIQSVRTCIRGTHPSYKMSVFFLKSSIMLAKAVHFYSYGNNGA